MQKLHVHVKILREKYNMTNNLSKRQSRTNILKTIKIKSKLKKLITVVSNFQPYNFVMFLIFLI